MSGLLNTVEYKRVIDSRAGTGDWRRWGTYLSERAWGTVREDYSAGGDAWDYFPHDHARSRAFRWSEDGIGGVCDTKQIVCLAVALWNEQDSILKERMFGLSNSQGNHGEDVKEYYFFVDGTPTNSYMKMLYKYPQVAYPYDDLVKVNGQRSTDDPEYELIDALEDAFHQQRYFDVFIEYAKVNPEDLLCRITVINRGPEAAPVHILPHIWYRNTWSWQPGTPRAVIQATGPGAAHTQNETLGEHWWYARTSTDQPLNLLFTENETNLERLYGSHNGGPYVKDGINEAVVHAQQECVNSQQGSKLAGQARAVLQPGETFIVQVRFSAEPFDHPFAGFDATFDRRIAEADEFYTAVHPATLSEDERLVQRQAFAGLLWSKQFYHYDVFRWLTGDPDEPTPPKERWQGRNNTWKHLNNADVILMPDSWEYPWYATWDLAFHCAVMARIDPDFAKQQLLLFTNEWYQHANGQIPAYEWNYDDVNPPVVAWAVLRVYRIDQAINGQADVEFLETEFHSLMLLFNWWLNRKDAEGRDVFGGGFLGMDNIGVFDRDQPLPSGGTLEQSDGTSWMAKFCANLLGMAIELAAHNRVYENMAVKYVEHFLYIAHAMTDIASGGIDLWDEEDKFFFDVIHLDSGENIPLKIHSMVGLVPLFAVLCVHPTQLEKLTVFISRVQWFLLQRPDLTQLVSHFDVPGEKGDWMISILHGDRLQDVLKRMLDQREFLSDYGIRAVSQYHRDHPYVFEAGGKRFDVHYLPAESDNRLFGGNSNWRGPIWFPVNYLLIRSLEQFGQYYGNTLKVEFPSESGKLLTLHEVAGQISRRLINIFLRDPERGGRRAVFGTNEYFQTDPHWCDYIPFHEYFNGDTGAAVGASHQTGWTALVASLLCDYSGSE